MQRLIFQMMFCAVGLVALLVLVQPSVARTLIVAVNNAPPYRVVDEEVDSTTYSGIYIDVMREAAKRAGLGLAFTVVPFKRALYLLERGEADLMLGPNRTEERQKYMYYFGAALPDEPKAVYIGQSDPDIRDVKDLNDKTVGVLRGASYNWRLQDATDVRLIEAADYSTLFRMLDMQHINALIVPELQAVEQIRREGPYHIRKAELVLQGQPSFIAISRRSDYFTDGSFTKLERVLVDMRQDGTFGRIYNRYATPAQ